VIAEVVGGLVTAALCVFQVCLAAGAPWGRLAWGGAHATLPKGLRIGSAVSAAVMAALCWYYLAGAYGWPPTLSDSARTTIAWVLTALFTAGTIMNAASRSKPERLVMTPVNLVLLACSLSIALSG
jgi:hypothetical protein